MYVQLSFRLMMEWDGWGSIRACLIDQGPRLCTFPETRLVFLKQTRHTTEGRNASWLQPVGFAGLPCCGVHQLAPDWPLLTTTGYWQLSPPAQILVSSAWRLAQKINARAEHIYVIIQSFLHFLAPGPPYPRTRKKKEKKQRKNHCDENDPYRFPSA